MNEGIKRDFQTVVWDYYRQHGRHNLPWRQPEADGTFDPYKIMVSELMLQQTQVSRVLSKYGAFLKQFPTITALSRASLGDVLRAWSGLGYNRRAKYLWRAAQQIGNGEFPTTVNTLTNLPGIGPNTAGAIVAYAFNQPAVFIETNLRTVYIHHFYHDQSDIPDKVIRELIQETLDHEQPRDWYWALMDYGSYLKQEVGNLNKLSKHYTKQTTFRGSRREIRGAILRLLGSDSHSVTSLQRHIPDDRLPAVLNELLGEGLIRQRGNKYLL